MSALTRLLKWPARHRHLTLRAREARLAYALVIPALLLVLLIIIFPAIWNVVLSFRPIRIRDLPNINLFELRDLGIDNYIVGLSRRFFIALRVTLIYTLSSTLLAILGGLWAALIAKDHFKGRQIFRAFLLFPYIAPVVSSAFVWRLMLDKNIGIVNALGARYGLEGVGWLTTRSLPVTVAGFELGVPLALLTVIAFEAWRYFPFAYLFILARLQAIPEELYEAAMVDGATPLQRLRFITLPLLTPVIATLFLLRFIWTFYKFEDIFLLNGGAAGTEVLSVQIFNWLFARRNVGVAAAIGVILALLLIVLVAIYQAWLSRQEEM
jgi:multiple sugar transport system permease protein